MVRDFGSGAVVAKLMAPPEVLSLTQCCFSPDGRLVACAAGLYLVVWDITKPEAQLVACLIGHSSLVSFIAFPSFLVLGSGDKSIKFWQSSNFLADPVTARHMAVEYGSTNPVEFANLFAGDNTVVTCHSRGLVKTWDLTTGRCKESFQAPGTGSRLAAHLAGDTFTAVWWKGNQYHIWDVGRGEVVRTVHSSFNRIDDMKISGDGSKIFGLNSCCVETRSIETEEEVERVSLKNEVPWSRFIVRGSKVEYGNKKGWGWNFESPRVSNYGELPDRPRLDLVDWSGGMKIIPRWIEDRVTKRLVFRLPETRAKSHAAIVWDGRYLMFWSGRGELAIMDFDSICHRLSS